MINLRYHVNSFFSSISYFLGNTMIDVGDEWDAFHHVKAILLTHAHFDHIYGLNRLHEINPNIPIYTNSFGYKALLDSKVNLSKYQDSQFELQRPENIIVVRDGEITTLPDNNTAKAIFTPGHNPSCITWVIGDCIFSGDAYIPGIKTVTNLPYCNKSDAEQSIATIKKLAINKIIFAGHSLHQE